MQQQPRTEIVNSFHFIFYFILFIYLLYYVQFTTLGFVSPYAFEGSMFWHFVTLSWLSHFHMSVSTKPSEPLYRTSAPSVASQSWKQNGNNQLVCWTAQHSTALCCFALPYKLLAHCEMLFHNIFTFLLLCSPLFWSFCLFCFYNIFCFFLFSLICFLLFACRLYVFYLRMLVGFRYFRLAYLLCVLLLLLSILIELCSKSLWL